jgi:YVTN family beta-propeller protein
MKIYLAALLLLANTIFAFAGQAPGAAEQADIAVSVHDRFYTSDQFSNTVSVINPASNKLLGVIRLGEPTPGNLSPLYRGQLLVHGMGFFRDEFVVAFLFGVDGAMLASTKFKKARTFAGGRGPASQRQVSRRFVAVDMPNLWRPRVRHVSPDRAKPDAGDAAAVPVVCGSNAGDKQTGLGRTC